MKGITLQGYARQIESELSHVVAATLKAQPLVERTAMGMTIDSRNVFRGSEDGEFQIVMTFKCPELAKALKPSLQELRADAERKRRELQEIEKLINQKSNETDNN